jgi:hypothetical protein
MCLSGCTILFARMQDDSNLRLPSKRYVCQGKMYLSKSKITPLKIKHLLKNIILLLSYTYIQRMSVSVCLYKSVALVSIFVVPSSSSHSLLIFPFSSLPFHNIHHQSYSLHRIYSTSENPSQSLLVR